MKAKNTAVASVGIIMALAATWPVLAGSIPKQSMRDKEPICQEHSFVHAEVLTLEEMLCFGGVLLKSRFERNRDIILNLILLVVLCVWGAYTAPKWYQARKARQIKREEELRERQIKCREEALANTNELINVLITKTASEALSYMNDKRDWIVMSVPLLPLEFSRDYTSIVMPLGELRTLEDRIREMPDGEERRSCTEKMTALKGDMLWQLEKARQVLLTLAESPNDLDAT